ncbi:MAG: hypothetical protein ACN4GR_15585 [Arenicellales bacterium]
MKKIYVFNGYKLVASILLATLFIASPGWSDPGKKPSIKDDANSSVLEKKDVKEGVGKGNVLKGDKKKEGTIKKNAVKKAGTAAVAGVATKKVTSTIKK